MAGAGEADASREAGSSATGNLRKSDDGGGGGARWDGGDARNMAGGGRACWEVVSKISRGYSEIHVESTENW